MSELKNQTDSNRSPAEVYENLFVPALLGQWSRVMADIVDLKPGQHVLDVATGTGVLAIEAARRVGDKGAVTGADPNPAMLEVARRKSRDVKWVEAKGESLPFPDNAFDAVVSQFGLMFFDDKVGGLREMMRVLKSGGKMAVAVWDSIEHSPGYAALNESIEQLFGEEVASAYRAPFTLGDPQKLTGLCDEAGIASAEITKHDGAVTFESIEAMVYAEQMCTWSLGGLLNEEQFRQLLGEAERVLQPFVKEKGQVRFDVPVLVIFAAKK
jgi:SAM-dependent methyltransferase